MERLRYRSTSLVDLQAEMRQRQFLAETERARPPQRTAGGRRRTFLGLPIPGRRPRD
jgi:hypothetical protein